MARQTTRGARTKRHPNLGSSLDELLAEDGVAAEVDAAARKRVAVLRALPDGRPAARRKKNGSRTVAVDQ